MHVREVERAGRVYDVAYFADGPPSPDDVAAVVDRRVSGISLERDALVRGVRGQLSWLRDVTDLRYLSISSRGAVSIPPEVLPRLECLSWHGPSSQTLTTSQMPSLRALALNPARRLVGDLRSCPDLAWLTLAYFDRSDLALVDGCAGLTSLKLAGRRQILGAHWSEPPVSLQVLMLQGLYLANLPDFGPKSALRNFRADFIQPLESPPALDLRMLRGCASLEWLAIERLGDLHNLDVLRGLTGLRDVKVREGHFTPTAVPGVPLSILPA
ncbi:hypothetical protein [Cellulomonas sp. NS3]|uniref:hypothetical protein n=1 Tax=Cellulomonas sp. NS3 TaxID=2973977 RepID=UPI0021616783|nr:hypothetical protein [Cellulomonas sp. NS3]